MKRATSLRWSPSLVTSLKKPYFTVTVIHSLRSSVPLPMT